jgi:hypothetical protein
VICVFFVVFVCRLRITIHLQKWRLENDKDVHCVNNRHVSNTRFILKIINSRKNHNLETAEQLRSPFLWLLALFASIVVLIANVYIGGAAKAQLSSLADATRVNALLSELDLFMVVVGGVATPLAGVVLWLTGFPLVATLVCLMTAGAALLAAFAGSLPLYAQYLLMLFSLSLSLSLSLSHVLCLDM